MEWGFEGRSRCYSAARGRGLGRQGRSESAGMDHAALRVSAGECAGRWLEPQGQSGWYRRGRRLSSGVLLREPVDAWGGLGLWGSIGGGKLGTSNPRSFHSRTLQYPTTTSYHHSPFTHFTDTCIHSITYSSSGSLLRGNAPARLYLPSTTRCFAKPTGSRGLMSVWWGREEAFLDPSAAHRPLTVQGYRQYRFHSFEETSSNSSCSSRYRRSRSSTLSRLTM